MAIDNVGWTIRPSPVQNDGKRRQQPKRKPQKPQPQRDSGKRQGGIDELA
jgi:hypothetical protein